jgi:hypothetical protein
MGKAVVRNIRAEVSEHDDGERFVVGHIDSDGEDIDLRVLVLKTEEMLHLLKFWVGEAFEERFWLASGQYASAWIQRHDFAEARWGLIESLLPKEKAQKAVDQAVADFKDAHRLSDEDWNDFLKGEDRFRQKFFENASEPEGEEAG